MENDVFHLSHGVKIIHPCNLYQQHTHWSERFLQLYIEG